MLLNRKSAKKTSRVSLFVAVAMLATIFGVLQTQGYPVEHMAENGMNVCKTGVAEFINIVFW